MDRSFVCNGAHCRVPGQWPCDRPAMGFNTWNAFHEDIDEELARESAELLISTGLAAAGYTYFNLDGASLPAVGCTWPPDACTH